MRVNAYIDVWNLYNAERKLEDYRLEWLNLRALCQHFCNENDMLNAVYYFTAYADRRNSNNPKSNNACSNRQYSYINDFLKLFGVNTIYGYMQKGKSKPQELSDNKEKKKGQEKYTDVNLALQMFEDAMYDRFDKAILLSDDSDFIPAIERVTKLKKKVLVLIPPTLNYNEIRKTANKDNAIQVRQLTEENLATHLLPAESKNGVKMPRQYLSKTQQAREQTEEFTKKLKYTSWNPTLCEKCKDYLRYESYDRLKQNRKTP